MKVLFLTESLDYGGAAKMITFVANSLTDKNIEVTILLSKNDNIIQQSIDKRIKIINSIPTNGQLKHIKNIYRLKNIIKGENPNIVVSFLTFPNLYASIIGVLSNVPVIISERGNPFALKGIKNKIILWMFNLAKGAVFQTEGAKKYFGKGLQKRSCVIPNPVVRKSELVKYDPSCENHEIAFIARFENIQKRQDLMIDALEKVIEVFPDTILKFYGTGDDLPMIEQLVKKKNLDNNVVFKGYTNTPELAMVKSEVFVLTSDYEGIPNSIIEAMSIGMPVVSTDCDPGGARILIENGKNGFLVRKNNAQDIADAIIKIFLDKALRKKLSEEAYRITERFTKEKIANQWFDYIHRIARK